MKSDSNENTSSNFDNPTSLDSKNDLPEWVAQLTPSIRAMIFAVEQPVDLSQQIVVRDLSIVMEHLIPEMQTRVLVCKVSRAPSWIRDKTRDDFEQAVYELVVIHWDKETGLLFVNSSFEKERLFQQVAQSVAHRVKPLPLFDVQKVFAGVINARFVNVGMRHRILGNLSEAYRMLTGPDAHLAVTRTDAKTHVKGHAFGCGDFGKGLTSLGFTDSGKVWSPNKADDLQELISHFKTLAKRIASSGRMVSNSELDNLSAGEQLGDIPTDIIAVAWPDSVYHSNYTLENIPLSDWEIRAERMHSTKSILYIAISYDSLSILITFQAIFPHFSYAAKHTSARLNGSIELVDFLNSYPPRLFTSIQSMILGSTIYHSMTGLSPFKIEKLDVRNWAGVDIKREIRPSNHGISVHTSVEHFLRTIPITVDYLIYDHASGEIADFITVKASPEVIRVTLYHVKASSGIDAGHRVEDLYEVCGQAVKSVQWLKIHKLLNQILTRTKSKFIIGTRVDFERLVAHFKSHPTVDECRIVIVQPGISKAQITTRMQEILAATEDYIHRAGDAEFEVWVSA